MNSPPLSVDDNYFGRSSEPCRAVEKCPPERGADGHRPAGQAAEVQAHGRQDTGRGGCQCRDVSKDGSQMGGGGLPPSQRAAAPRSWRTRHDPFAGIWEAEVVPLLEKDEEGVFEAARLFEELQERHPGRFSPGQLRTLQRRVRDWKALRGPARQVIFPQVHPPGREAVQLPVVGVGEGRGARVLLVAEEPESPQTPAGVLQHRGLRQQAALHEIPENLRSLPGRPVRGLPAAVDVHKDRAQADDILLGAFPAIESVDGREGVLAEVRLVVLEPPIEPLRGGRALPPWSPAPHPKPGSRLVPRHLYAENRHRPWVTHPEEPMRPEINRVVQEQPSSGPASQERTFFILKRLFAMISATARIRRSWSAGSVCSYCTLTLY